MIIRWRRLTRGQKVWAVVTACLWLFVVVATTTFAIMDEITSDGNMVLTVILVLASCSTVCLKMENSRHGLDRAFKLGYKCRALEEGGCRVARMAPVTVAAPEPRSREHSA